MCSWRHTSCAYNTYPKQGRKQCLTRTALRMLWTQPRPMRSRSPTTRHVLIRVPTQMLMRVILNSPTLHTRLRAGSPCQSSALLEAVDWRMNPDPSAPDQPRGSSERVRIGPSRYLLGSYVVSSDRVRMKSSTRSRATTPRKRSPSRTGNWLMSSLVIRSSTAVSASSGPTVLRAVRSSMMSLT